MSPRVVTQDEKTLWSKISVEKILKTLYLTRLSDQKMEKLVRQNKGGTFHLAVSGHELIGAIAGLTLEKGKDWALPYYRDRATAIGMGADLKELFGVFLGRKTKNHSSGRMMPEHFSDPDLNIPCQSSCVGSQFLHAVGVAKGLQLSQSDGAVYVSAGDGATSQGDFHEALNFACLHKLNVIFVIQDNEWAISVPLLDQVAGGCIAKRSQGFENLQLFAVDGCDYAATYNAFSKGIERGREGIGPSLIVAKVPRLVPHSSSDDPKKYKDDDLIEDEKKNDPIPRFEALLLDKELVTPKDLERLRKEALDEVEEAALYAEELPYPDPESAGDRVYAPYTPPVSKGSEEEGESIVIMDALNKAMQEEMERDPHVVVFGEDVAHGKGGVFGITRTLTDKFGEDRCFNTPLAESTIIALALGMSLVQPFKPVAEIQFADYIWPGINQLFSELSSIYYRSNGVWNCPVVVRIPYGGYIQGGPYHSQSIEGFLAHCPGLKIAIPSNAADAKRLLKTAIRDPNPVIFLEHKALYRQRVFCARNEPSSDELLPFGQAEVVKEGSDLTVVAWGMPLFMVNDLANKLSQEGIDVEVIDPRTIVPFDYETVLQSVKKTGKLLIAHEAALTGGFGGEIAARISEEAFEYLDAPIARVAAKDCPVPYSKVLEDAVLPQSSDLEKAIRRLASF